VPDSVNRGWDHGLIGGAKYWMPNYNAVGMFAHYILGVITAGVIVKLRQQQTRSSWLFDGIALTAFVVMMVFLWTQRYAPDFAFSLGHQPYFYPIFPLLVAIQLSCLPFENPWTFVRQQILSLHRENIIWLVHLALFDPRDYSFNLQQQLSVFWHLESERTPADFWCGAGFSICGGKFVVQVY
jgi:hypothetical protein